jgi:hypothetical protein
MQVSSLIYLRNILLWPPLATRRLYLDYGVQNGCTSTAGHSLATIYFTKDYFAIVWS